VPEAVHWSALSPIDLLRVLENRKLTATQQEKRYRSMQEHIRRAHPDYYIPKLPATEESFQLMISTPPSQKPPQQPAVAASARKGPGMLAT